MKIKAISVYISFILVVVSIAVIFSMFYVSNTVVQIIVNIFYGVFGSSLVTLMISIYEYQISKKSLLNNFFVTAVELLNKVVGLSFFDLNNTTDAYITFYFFNKMMGTKEVLNDFIKEMTLKIKLDYSKDDIVLTEKDFINGANIFIPLFNKSVRSYVDYLKETDFHKIGLMLDDVYFLIKPLGKKIKKKQWEIYELIMDTCKQTKIHCASLNSYMSQGAGSYKELKKDFKALTSYFFEIKGKGCWAIVENKLFDLLEEYRCLIYKKEYIKKEHGPKYTINYDSF